MAENVECEEHGLIGCRDAACFTPPKPTKQTGFRRGVAAAREPSSAYRSTRPTAVEAKYHGFCQVCRQSIEVGDPIVREVPGDEMSPWLHEECYE